MKKRIWSVLLMPLIAFNIVVSRADDIGGHWAEGSIRKLIERGIISGDGTGNIRPDDSITRAEFVKVVNRTFGFAGKGGEQFPDVEETKWYALEFSAAKAAGFLMGDEQGNARPEETVTRNEVSVILARVLGLSDNSAHERFSDEIPLWARSGVGALAKAGYLTGYEDGSFRGENKITRGEAFSLVSRLPMQASEAGWGNQSSMEASGSGSTSSGGGGGNGGSGGGQISQATVTVNQYDSEEQKLYFTADRNTGSVVVKIEEENTSFSREYPGLQISSQYGVIDLKRYIEEISSSTDHFKLKLTVRLKAIGKSGAKDSSFVKGTVIEMELPHLAAPAPVSKIESILGKDTVMVSWEPVLGAAGYEVKYYVDGRESADRILNLKERILVIPDASAIKSRAVFVSVRALSRDIAVKPSEAVSLPVRYGLITGSGTQTDPYVIRNEAAFNSITDLNGIYHIVSNLDLGEIQPLGTETEPFRGKLIGKLGYSDNRARLRFTMKGNSNYRGLVGVLEGGTIENLIIEGEIKGSQYVGGFAGAVKGGVIRNCINRASVISETASHPYTGGIAGGSLKGNALLIEGCENQGTIRGNAVVANTNYGSIGGIIGLTVNLDDRIISCRNKGDISTTGRNVGGIVGYLNTGSVSLCSNTASVTSTNTSGCVGGVVGASYGLVKQSFNSGVVKGYTLVGGIAGNAGGTGVLEISDTYNMGSVTATSGNAGGICYSMGTPTTTSSTLVNNYTIGNVTAGGTAVKAYNNVVGVQITVQGNYYLNTVLGNLPAANPPVGLSHEQMLLMGSYAGYDPAVWNIYDDGGYPYARLKGIEERGQREDISPVTKLMGAFEKGVLNLTFTHPAPETLSHMTLTVIRLSDYRTLHTEEILPGTTAVTRTLKDAAGDCLIRLTAFSQDGRSAPQMEIVLKAEVVEETPLSRVQDWMESVNINETAITPKEIH